MTLWWDQGSYQVTPLGPSSRRRRMVLPQTSSPLFPPPPLLSPVIKRKKQKWRKLSKKRYKNIHQRVLQMNYYVAQDLVNVSCLHLDLVNWHRTQSLSMTVILINKSPVSFNYQPGKIKSTHFRWLIQSHNCEEPCDHWHRSSNSRIARRWS